MPLTARKVISPRRIASSSLNMGQIALSRASDEMKIKTPSVWDLLEDSLAAEKTEIRNLMEYNQQLNQLVSELIDENDAYDKSISEMKTTITALKSITLRSEKKEDRRFEYHEVAEGESLSLIAKNSPLYRDALMWPALYSFNRDIISDPDLIYPGQIITIRVPD